MVNILLRLKIKELGRIYYLFTIKIKIPEETMKSKSFTCIIYLFYISNNIKKINIELITTIPKNESFSSIL
jgi:hypothetical protein